MGDPVSQRRGYSYFFLLCILFGVISITAAWFLSLECDSARRFRANRRRQQAEHVDDQNNVSISRRKMETTSVELVAHMQKEHQHQSQQRHQEQEQEQAQKQQQQEERFRYWRGGALADTSIMVAISAQIAVQFNMILIMTATPLAIVATVPDVRPTVTGGAIILHIISMFIPGLGTSSLISSVGVMNTVHLGLLLQMACQVILLVCSGNIIDGAFDTQTASVVKITAFYISLSLLGIGWNFSYLAGTIFLKSRLSPPTQQREQQQQQHLQQEADDDAKFIQTVNEFARFLSTAVASLAATFAQKLYEWNIILLIGLGYLVTTAVILIVFERCLM